MFHSPRYITLQLTDQIASRLTRPSRRRGLGVDQCRQMLKPKQQPVAVGILAGFQPVMSQLLAATMHQLNLPSAVAYRKISLSAAFRHGTENVNGTLNEPAHQFNLKPCQHTTSSAHTY